jgi:hypothetical protein
MTEIVVVPLCESLTPPFENLTQAILSSPPGTPAGIEQILWTEWVGALSSPYDELNYRVVRTRLVEVGLSHLFTGTRGAMTGEYSGEEVTSESRKQINVNARVLWLQSRNVPVTTGSGRAVDMLFEVGSAREALARQVTQGRRGKYVGQRRIDVDGAIVPVAGQIPPAASEGDAVVVDTVHPSWFHLRYLAEEYATTGVHSKNIVDLGSVGVEVLWDLYRDRPPFRYP